MPAFDRLLLDPTEDDVAGALVEAVGQANYRCRLGRLPPDPGEYRRRAGEVARQREGSWQQVAGFADPLDYPPQTRATLVGLAWWTDVLGRRHARVAGRRLEQFNEFHQHRFGPLRESRPPLWLVHPERLYLRTLPGRPRELLALCGCGALGDPTALGWTGDCCGPCHDRREEGVRVPADGGPLTLRGRAGGATAVAFSASGRTVVSAGFGGARFPRTVLFFWERATGRILHEHSHGFHMESSILPFACDGRLAIADGLNILVAWDAETGDERWTEHGRRLWVLALSADGRTLFGTRSAGLFTRALELGAQWQEHGRLGDIAFSSLAVSPGGAAVAYGTFRGLYFSSSFHGAPRQLAADSVRALAFSPSGRTLLVGFGPTPQAIAAEEFSANPCRVQLWDLGTERPLDFPPHRGAVHAVGFTPDGSLTVSAGADRRVRFCDAQTGREVGTLEWHVGTVTAVAFSPDGGTLATASADGLVRLWPWRRLLAAP